VPFFPVLHLCLLQFCTHKALPNLLTFNVG
jgi:hypothetical protein